MAHELDPNCNNGTAALNICESLLLALTDLKVISEENVRALLTDVATPTMVLLPVQNRRR